MGGIATAVQNNDAMYALKVKEGDKDDEFLITRHSQFVVPINIINIYGEQEGRTSKEDIRDRWGRIMNEVVKIEAKEEFLLIFGDLNKKVGDVINGNDNKVAFGGQLVRDFISTDKYILVNSTNKVVNGPFTRHDPSDPKCQNKKSFSDTLGSCQKLQRGGVCGSHIVPSDNASPPQIRWS